MHYVCGSKVGKKQGSNEESRYYVQLSTFRNYNSAHEYQLELFCQGYYADVVRRGECYSILSREFHNLDDAVRHEVQLRRAGFHTSLLKS